MEFEGFLDLLLMDCVVNTGLLVSYIRNTSFSYEDTKSKQNSEIYFWIRRCVRKANTFCFISYFERDLFKMKPLIDGFFTDTTNLRIKFLFHAETLYSSSILKFCYAFTTSKYLIYNGKNFFSKKNYYIQTRIAHSWLIYLKRV